MIISRKSPEPGSGSVNTTFRRVADVLVPVATKRGLKRNEYAAEGALAIVDQGQALIAGRTDELDLEVGDGPYVVFGDHTRTVKWVDFPFAVGADGTKVLRSVDGVLPKYAYFAFSNLDVPARGYNRHWTVAREMQIPVPEVPVQQEIVDKLDAFVGLQYELEAELTARKRQMAHVRQRLVGSLDGVERRRLSEVLTIRDGRDYTHLGAGGIPVYGSGGVMGHVDTAANTRPTVLIPRKGSIGNLFYVDGPMWTIDTIFWTEIDESILSPRFLFHYLSTLDLASLNTAGGLPSLTKAALYPIEIPVPTPAEQSDSVRILDGLDTLVNNPSIGLPAELAARRKQYEYYRDKLLTFKELPA